MPIQEGKVGEGKPTYKSYHCKTTRWRTRRRKSRGKSRRKSRRERRRNFEGLRLFI
jgi:hypothetical protein